MNDYRHHVSGFFSHQQEAESALSKLVALGLPRERLYITHPDATSGTAAQQADDNGVLTHVLVDGAIGTAVGTGIGALAELALVAANVSLFIASPLIAPLAMLGWGASLGGLVGAATGAASTAASPPKDKEGTLAALIRDAVSSGQVVLVAQTRSELETANARHVMQESVDATSGMLTDGVVMV